MHSLQFVKYLMHGNGLVVNNPQLRIFSLSWIDDIYQEIVTLDKINVILALMLLMFIICFLGVIR